MADVLEPQLEGGIQTWVVDNKESSANNFALATGGMVVDLPMASAETGIVSAVIYPENFKPELKKVYRGSRSALPETLENQAASMLRDTSKLEDNNPYTRRVNILPIVEDLKDDVIDLARNPSLEKHKEIISKAPPQLQEEMRAYLGVIENYMKAGISYEQALYKAHINAYEGAYGATPYLSLYEKLPDSLKYAASTSEGCILLINVAPEDYTDPKTEFKHEGELYANGVLPKNRIYGVILTNNMINPTDNPKTITDIKDAVDFVNERVTILSRPSPQ